MGVKIGADPELFLGLDGQFVSAHDLIPGTKLEPFPVNKGAVQVDGVAAEINIEPASTAEEFVENIEAVTQELRKLVPNYDFLHKSTVRIDPFIRSLIPENALAIGCNPDTNAYTEYMNEGPDQAIDIRAAGGHLHISGFWREGAPRTEKHSLALRLARLLDKYVGVYSLLWDEDDDRRKIYGRGGACRFKEDYGVEYRTLSNKWLFSSALAKFVFNQVQKATDALAAGEDVGPSFYKKIIDESDRLNPFFKEDPVAREITEKLLPSITVG